MKTIHIHIAADDIEQSASYYAALLGQVPTVTNPDYIKWEMEDPRINLSITQRGTKPAGVDHLGIQVESEEELEGVHAGLAAANIPIAHEPGANCCYAQSDKHWAKDPQGVIWEVFHSHGRTAVYGDDPGPMSREEALKA